MPKLKYIGMGSWMYGIPAMDLTAEEVEKHGGVECLVGTGLYEVIQKESEAEIIFPPGKLYVDSEDFELADGKETKNN